MKVLSFFTCPASAKKWHQFCRYKDNNGRGGGCQKSRTKLLSYLWCDVDEKSNLHGFGLEGLGVMVELPENG